MLRFFQNKAVGIVLSGGGFKGVSYIGLFKAFEKLNIPVDIVCAVSVGTIFGFGLAMEYGYRRSKEVLDDVLPQFIESFSELTIDSESTTSSPC